MTDLRTPIEKIEFSCLSFSYTEQTPIFHNISFQFPHQPAVWVRAPGGRGKSSCLKIIAGLLRPNAGDYLINGESIASMSFEEFLKFRLNIGYGFDFGGLLNNRTIEENLLLPLLYHKLVPIEQAYQDVEMLLKRFGIFDIKNLRPYSVSGSQRKLTCLIRAFVHKPEIVLLDEPLNGLKDQNVQDLVSFIREAYQSRGLKQILFSSENLVLPKQLNAEEIRVGVDSFSRASQVAA